MLTPAPHDRRWVEMARIVENLGNHTQALAEAGGREAERLGGLAQAIRTLQEAAQTMSQQRGTGGRAPHHYPKLHFTS